MKKSNRTAWESALHLIGYRAQSEWEIRTKLKRKGYEAEDIEKTVSLLYRYQYLDDEALAEEIFLRYQSSLLYGDRYIQGKLHARGLTIDRHLTEEEERGKAAEALRIRLRTVPGLLEDYRRAAGFLLRRGFSQTAVRAVLDEAAGEQETF